MGPSSSVSCAIPDEAGNDWWRQESRGKPVVQWCCWCSRRCRVGSGHDATGHRQDKDAGRRGKETLQGNRRLPMQILKNDGVMFFYAGTWPRMIRVSLDVAITFAI